MMMTAPSRKPLASDNGPRRGKVPPIVELALSGANATIASNQATPVHMSTNSDSDSDGYVGAKKNAPTKKQKQRQLLIANGRLPPSQAEVRFSSRRSKQVTNYNEDEEDPFVEDEDENMTPNYWATTVEDAGPTIDKILDHRPADESGKPHPSQWRCPSSLIT
jgi:hypothetical protein